MTLDVIVHKESTAVVPVGAILLYGAAQVRNQPEHSLQFATVHKMDLVQGAPQILPGRPITINDLQLMSRSLTQQHAQQATVWLDPYVLAKGPDRLIWWTPPQARPMFFRATSQSTFTATATCPTPALVWMAMKDKGLYLWAIKGNQRPTQETPLFQAPFFNVWESGLVCAGNANVPDQNQYWNVRAWEEFFFGSYFTHPNIQTKNRLIKGVSPLNFWENMCKTPLDEFPVARLVPVSLAAGDLIDPQFLERASARPGARGGAR